ncbi:unnamed protein product [Sphagnum jensenii]|uniref:Uncharacterized protein n=1 Tax=Sphagnum jensenii TaxID=128206 RepID=A0ABP1B7I4_9BRYO
MREIVQVQVGNYANFVGAHFWNFQDEALGISGQGEEEWQSNTGVDMDVLYRVGETRQGVPTYTPRLLVFDARESLGAVRAVGSLYEAPVQPDPSSITTWSGTAAMHKAEPYKKNEFLQSLDEEEESWDAGSQNQASMSGNGYHTNGDIMMQETDTERAQLQALDDTVLYWTDYQKAHLHPQSVYELQSVWNGVTPFDHYGSGQGLLTQQEQRDEVQDRLRFFVEECDQLQGFQFLVDTSGGFAAVASDVLEEVREEYGRSCCLLFSLRPPWTVPAVPNHRASVISGLHDAVSLARLSSLANLFVPLGLQNLASSRVAMHLCLNDSKLFHSSAVYAAAVNTISLPFRMEPSGPTSSSWSRGVGSTDLSSLVQLVSRSQQRRVAMMEAALPGAFVPGDPIHGIDLKGLASLTQGVDYSIDETEAAEALVLQGSRLAGVGTASVSQVLECMNSSETSVRRGALTLTHLAISPIPLSIPLPFPMIFGPNVGRRGDILPDKVSQTAGRGGLDIVSSSVAARVSTGESMLPYVKERSTNFRNLGVSRSSVGSRILEEWGFAKEEAHDLGESLGDLVTAYGERRGDEGSSDSD